MKKIFLFLVTGAFLLNTGCVELDLSPSTALPTNEAITSTEDLQMAVYGVFEMMSLDRGGHASDFGLYADVKGGDTFPYGDNGHIVVLTKYEMTQNITLASQMYFALYEPIAFANLAMSGAENLPGYGSDPEITDLYGQLIAARALLHFDAARAYSQIPTVAGVDMNKANSGVVIVDQVYPMSTKFSRSTLAETYKFVTDELERAIPMLSTKKNLGGINAWAAKLILARAYLYMGQYDKAYSYAADVANNSGYKLFTPDNYVSAWKMEGADEFIFEILTSDNTANSPQRNSLGYYTNPNGYGEVGAHTDLIAAVNALDANDIRKESISERDDQGARKGYYTIKYMGREGTSVYSSNPKIARLAEAYLIAAEAALKGGSTADNALKFYNDLRKSRYAAGTYTAATSVTLDDILAERRVELFCENHRLFDLVRNNLSVTKYDGTATYAANDNLILNPLPLREIDVNPDLVQNPGY